MTTFEQIAERKTFHWLNGPTQRVNVTIRATLDDGRTGVGRAFREEDARLQAVAAALIGKPDPLDLAVSKG